MIFQRFVKLMVVCMIFICILVVPVSVSGNASKNESESGYKAISVDNDYYRLNVNEEDGRFTLFNKRNGHQIHSYPDGLDEDRSMKNAGRIRVRSALFITVLDVNTEAKTILYSNTDSVNEGGLKVTASGNDIVAEYDFKLNDVVVPVHYTLDGERLLISVLPDEIRETGSLMVTDISIHPYFYSGNSTENGFMLVPDGSGSLIYFNNKKYTVSPYIQKVYGRDLSLYQFSKVEYAQPVLMPIFGISKESGSVLGVITAGSGDAYLEASPGIGISSYNCAYATFKLMAQDMMAYPNDNRTDVDVYPEERNDTKLLQVSYTIREESNLSYVKLAELYREYLIEAYGLKRIGKSSYPVYLDFYMSTIRKKSFLGVTYMGVETATTFNEAQSLVEKLHKMGIPTVVRLNNWSDQTVRGKVLNGADMLSSVGSKKDLESLKAAVEKNGRLYLNGNISEVYSKGYFARFFSYAKNMRMSTIEYQEYNLATNFLSDSVHYLLSHKNILKYSSKFGKAVSGLGFNTISVDGLNNMFTDYSADKVSMSGTVDIYQQALWQLKDSGLNVAVTGGNQYALGDASLILGMPGSDSMFEVCDESVPFYAIALHGYVPFAIEPINISADPEKAYLKTLETGSGLYFQWIQAAGEKVRYSRNSELYCSNADAWMESALSHYEKYQKFMSDKQSQIIIGHQQLAENVYRTTFEDGSYVIVNYSSTVYQAGGFRIEAMSYNFGKDLS